MEIEIFENNQTELMAFLKSKGDPFEGFILLFETMIPMAKNFEYSPFKEKIESFKNAIYYQRMIKGILDLNNTVFIDYEEEE